MCKVDESTIIDVYRWHLNRQVYGVKIGSYVSYLFLMKKTQLVSIKIFFVPCDDVKHTVCHDD